MVASNEKAMKKLPWFASRPDSPRAAFRASSPRCAFGPLFFRLVSCAVLCCALLNQTTQHVELFEALQGCRWWWSSLFICGSSFPETHVFLMFRISHSSFFILTVIEGAILVAINNKN